MKFKNPEGQIARWLETLAAYDFDVVHRPGRLHNNADSLSRIPCKQCGRSEVPCADEGKDETGLIAAIGDGDMSQGLREAQEKDEDINTVKSWIEAGARPDSSEIASKSYFLKSLWNQWPRLEICDDLLVRRWEDFSTNDVLKQAVVPLAERRTVLKFMHDIKSSGHLGISKTLSRVRQRYYWPGLRNDVKAYIAGCDHCLRRKSPTKTKAAPMQIVRSGYPMERIAVDILGELPTTEKGNKYVLVIADYFTKWTECFPMPNMEARTVARIMTDEVIARFGVPDKIHSDQGRQFESALFTEMCEILQIDKTRTTPYHPQSDGLVERFNRTLLSMLSAFVNQNQNDWDELLPYVMMAYRSCEQETTSCSPNMLMLGREVTTPLDLMYEMPPVMREIPANQWVWELKERLERTHDFVRQHTGKSMHRQKKYRDRKIAYEKFEAGDLVYVFFPITKVGASAKLTSFWRGPFKVSAKLSDVLYRVNCGRAGADQVIHCDRLKKAKEQVLSHEDIGERNDSFESEIDPNLSFSEGEYDEEVEDADVDTHKRIRKRPQWLEDYVLSCSKVMPNLKTTPRKETVVQEESSRVRCNYCGASFKRLQYMMKHMRRIHQGQFNPVDNAVRISAKKTETAVAEPSTSGEKPQKEAVALSDSSSDTSVDWDVDPDVTVEEAEISKDRQEVQDPTVRKRTRPELVLPSKKPKLAETVNIPVAREECDEPQTTELSLKFGVEVRGDKSVRKVSVEQDGESLFESAGQAKGKVQMNLAEFIEDRQINSQDIAIEIHGMEISVGISYKK